MPNHRAAIPARNAADEADLSTPMFAVRMMRKAPAFTADPVVLVTVVGILSAVALAASYVPAQRAARVGPLMALRNP
jgi:hypothetical protein